MPICAEEDMDVSLFCNVSFDSNYFDEGLDRWDRVLTHDELVKTLQEVTAARYARISRLNMCRPRNQVETESVAIGSEAEMHNGREQSTEFDTEQADMENSQQTTQVSSSRNEEDDEFHGNNSNVAVYQGEYAPWWVDRGHPEYIEFIEYDFDYKINNNSNDEII